MILRNLDFSLSLYLVKGVSRFYKSDRPFYYDGILFKSLQTSKFYIQQLYPKKEAQSLYFFCLGLKEDTSYFNVPLLSSNKKNSSLLSSNLRENISNGYYTSYVYKFKFGSKYNTKVKLFKNTVRYFKSKRSKKKWRRRRLLKRLTLKSKRFWWTHIYFTRKLYRKQYGINIVKPIIVDTSVNIFRKSNLLKNKSLFLYRRLLNFFSNFFSNFIISRFFKMFFLRRLYCVYFVS